MSSHPVRQAPVDPGKQKINVPFATPPSARDAIVDVLNQAIVAGGSTLGDAQYVDLMGEGGSYQDEHRVYGRDGLRCETCGRGWIRRTVSGGRSTHWCPVCQR